MTQKNYLFPVLFFCAFALALGGLNPSFYMDDSPETITAAATLGVPHPPGYPLYTITARLFSLLPFSQIGFRVNLFSAFTASLVSLFLFLLLTGRFKVHALTAFTVSLLWMAGATSFPAALTSKMGIYQLTALFTLAILYCLLTGRDRLAAFLFGLSLANHWMSMVAFSPGFLFLFWRLSKKTGGGTRRWVEAFLWILVGSSLYLYLPLRGALEPAINWGYPIHFTEFHRHLSRYVDTHRDFSWNLPLWIEQAFFYFKSGLKEFSGVGLLAFWGAWALWRRDRAAAFGLGLSWAGLIGAICVFSKLSHEKPYLMEDYSISSFVFVLLGLGIGLGEIFGRIEKRTLKTFFMVFISALCIGLVTNRFFQSRQSFYTYTYDYALNALKAVPKDGLLFCKGDVLVFPYWYLQMLDGKRMDVAVLGGGSLPMDWYRMFLAKTYPGLKVPYPGHFPGKVYISGPLFRWMVDENPGRDYYFTYNDLTEDKLSDLKMLPYGLAMRGVSPLAASSWDQEKARYLWESMRLRHYEGAHRNMDERSWKYFLTDVGFARGWRGMYQYGQSITLVGPSQGKKPASAALKALYQESLGDFQWAYAWDNTKPLYPVMTSVILDNQGDFDEAAQWMGKAGELDPNNANVWVQKGVLELKRRNANGARSAFERALQLEPGNARALDAMKYLNSRSAPASVR